MSFHLGNQAGDGNSSNHVSHGGNGSSNGGNPTPYQNRSESWNGSSWTSRTSTLNQATGVSTYAGNDTSGIMIGGRDTGYDSLRTVEKWNGSSMTDVANLPAYYARSRCAGNDTKALSWNGRYSSDGSDGGSLTNHQLQYDGTTWTTKSNMPVTVESPNAGGEGL